MIRHSIILKLKPQITEVEKSVFLVATDLLKNIPNIQKFGILKQISPKSKLEYRISMEFDTTEQFDFMLIMKSNFILFKIFG